MTENLDNQPASSVVLGGYGGSLGDSALGGMSLAASGAAVTIGAVITASGVVEAAPSGALDTAVQAIKLADPLAKLLRVLLDAIENPLSPEVVLYAWALVLAIGLVTYIRVVYNRYKKT